MWSFVGKISKLTEFDDSMVNDVIKNSTHLNMTSQKPNFTPLCKRIRNTFAEKVFICTLLSSLFKLKKTFQSFTFIKTKKFM